MAVTASTTFRALRQQRQVRLLADLTCRLHSLVTPDDQLLEFLLFGSRARGDWDGYSDTELLVVAPEQSVSARWPHLLLEAGAAHNVLPLNCSRWHPMPGSPSPQPQSVMVVMQSIDEPAG